MNETQTDGHGLIFFDGVCNLCNQAVQFIIKRDRNDYFRFTALQSEAAIRYLSAHVISQNETNPGEPESILLLENGKVYERSAAALRIARKLNGLWPLCYVLIIIPPFIRDFFYKLIARNRYRVWGSMESCMVPAPELRKKFLS